MTSKLSSVSKHDMWKLAEPDLRDQLTEEARKIIQQRGWEETQDWETVTEDLRQLGEQLLRENIWKYEAGKGDMVVERG